MEDQRLAPHEGGRTHETAGDRPYPPDDDHPPAPASQNGRGRWLVFALLLLGIGMVVLFGLRSVRAYRHFHDQRARPISQDLDRLRPWMTLPDVARDFEVPLPYLYEALGVAPQTPDRRTLIDLNRRLAAGQRGAFEAKVRHAIEEYRRPPPGLEGQPPGADSQPPSPLPLPDERPPGQAQREPRPGAPRTGGAP